MTEILRRIWLFSANKIKSSESFSKQPTQLIVDLNSSLRHIIVTNVTFFIIVRPGEIVTRSGFQQTKRKQNGEKRGLQKRHRPKSKASLAFFNIVKGLYDEASRLQPSCGLVASTVMMPGRVSPPPKQPVCFNSNTLFSRKMSDTFFLFVFKLQNAKKCYILNN